MSGPVVHRKITRAFAGNHLRPGMPAPTDLVRHKLQNIPGWQSSAPCRGAFQCREPQRPWPCCFFKIDKFAGVMPISSAIAHTARRRRPIIIQINHDEHQHRPANRWSSSSLHADGLFKSVFSTRTMSAISRFAAAKTKRKVDANPAGRQKHRCAPTNMHRRAATHCGQSLARFDAAQEFVLNSIERQHRTGSPSTSNTGLCAARQRVGRDHPAGQPWAGYCHNGAAQNGRRRAQVGVLFVRSIMVAVLLLLQMKLLLARDGYEHRLHVAASAFIVYGIPRLYYRFAMLFIVFDKFVKPQDSFAIDTKCCIA